MSSLETVGFARRLGAIVYDSLLVGSVVILFGGILATLFARLLGVEELQPGSFPALLMQGVYWVIAFLFFGWFWTHGGQTLGMRAWKIRVVNERQETLNWVQAGMRYLMAIFSWLAFGVGFWIALFDPAKRTWHDRFSKTYLIRTH